MMYKLFYSPGACSFATHCMLEASGVSYEAIDASIAEGKTKTDSFLKLNPRARVPVLLENDQVLRESVALLIYLADKYPDSHLIPEIGSLERARCLEWLSYLTSTLHPLYWGIWRQERLSSDESAHQTILETCDRGLVAEYEKLNLELADKDYLLGEKISVADIYLFVFVRWGGILSKSTKTMPNLVAYMDRLKTYEPLAKTMAIEGIDLFRE